MLLPPIRRAPGEGTMDPRAARGHSAPRVLSPPTRRAPVEVTMDPLAAWLATCEPLTYSRNAEPSYVAATWIHVFRDSCDGPRTSWSVPPVTALALGLLVPVFPYSAYA